MAIKPNDPAIGKNHEQYTHPPGILVADYYHMPYGYTCYRPNGTKDWLIMYTISGKGLVHHEDQGYLECTEGTVTIIPPGVKHDFYTEQHEVWEKMWAHYTPRTAWSDWMPANKADRSIFHTQLGNTQTRTSIEHAFRRILSYRVEPVIAFQEEFMLNALEEIILILASQHADRKRLDPRVKEVLHILALDFAEPHQIEDLANQVYLSASRLSHLFKEQIGDSIVATLNTYRLKQAEKLLRYTERPITEIALNVGFHSPDYFTRQFTQYYGVKPSQYRKRFVASPSK